MRHAFMGLFVCAVVLPFAQMSRALTVRLRSDLAAWLNHAAQQAGISKSAIIRRQLEKARRREQPFRRLAGVVAGPQDLSLRRGFSLE